jgi:DUF4097 and DUF4098 domain-containing protein YvlB
MLEERKRILKMVEEGKLKAEEALTLLQELDKSQQSMEQKQEQLLNELSTVVDFEEGKKEEEHQSYKSHSMKDKVFDFVDTALKKIRDFDLDFNFGQGIDLSHIFQHADAIFTNIDVDIANGAVQIVPWEQSDVRIECQAKVYRVTNPEEARESFLKDIVFKIEHGTLQFAAQTKWLKVDAVLYVPKTEYDKVRVRLFNGPIQSENLHVKSMKAKTANGKITATGLFGNKLEAETVNGKIKVDKSQLQLIEAETINGAVVLDGDFANVEMQSFNGNVSCQLTGSTGENIEAKTVTGSIDLSIPDGYSVVGKLKSNIGGFNVELEGIQIIEDKSDMVQKSLSFKPTLTANQLLKVKAEAKTGSIAVKKAYVMNAQ